MGALFALPQLDSLLDEVQSAAVITSRQAMGDMFVAAVTTLNLQSIHQATHLLTPHGYQVIYLENGGCDFICSKNDLFD